MCRLDASETLFPNMKRLPWIARENGSLGGFRNGMAKDSQDDDTIRVKFPRIKCLVNYLNQLSSTVTKANLK